ncbi:hypothetical protein M7I_3144 [Glarea lozoyensis 74030]|uniref:Uncharacterized protein n=1 Tax=Glarea lozoyensis (strain ATCC 74030 / MF5533) TaxID=1104152 RepID=H0EKR5_GLAL7|nr:hypothetical protein M7I_3144 [Glarea lozoyensis 74030]
MGDLQQPGIKTPFVVESALVFHAPPHVTAFTMLSTGLGRLRLGGGFGGDEEAAIEKGRDKAAKLVAANPEFTRRKLLALSGDVDKLWVVLWSCS